MMASVESDEERARSRGCPRIGLVLGGGGLVGQAYHAGVLAALEHDFGWDPRAAEIIVGTSAGSISGALLRAGIPASELAAWTVRTAVSTETERMLEPVSRDRSHDPLRWTELLRPRIPDPALLWRLTVGPRPSVTAIALGLVRSGERDIEGALAFIDGLADGAWPSEELWISAVERCSGSRVAFGASDAPPSELRPSVAASCAVPGYFAPVAINGVDYIDGGVYSPTNADLLVDRASDLDLVIIVSPMSCFGPVAREFGGVVRRLCRRTLRREVDALERVGLETLTIEPTPGVVEAMGADLMNHEVLTEVVQQAFLGTACQTELGSAARTLLDRRVARDTTSTLVG